LDPIYDENVVNEFRDLFLSDEFIYFSHNVLLNMDDRHLLVID